MSSPHFSTLFRCIFVGIGSATLLTRDDERVFRSGPDTVTLISPAQGAKLVGTVAFVWRRIPESAYNLEVYSAAGRRVAQWQTRDSVLTLTAGDVPSGDYRWWVTTKLIDGTQVRSAT